MPPVQRAAVDDSPQLYPKWVHSEISPVLQNSNLKHRLQHVLLSRCGRSRLHETTEVGGEMVLDVGLAGVQHLIALSYIGEVESRVTTPDTIANGLQAKPVSPFVSIVIGGWRSSHR